MDGMWWDWDKGIWKHFFVLKPLPPTLDGQHEEAALTELEFFLNIFALQEINMSR